MLGPVRPTPYDLYFSIFGVPVRVNPFFWAAGTILGWSALRQLGPEFLLIWLLCMFVSILIHELGHVFAMQYYGCPAHIILYHFGGLAVPESSRGMSPGKSLVISLAGPGAGFLFYFLLRAIVQFYFKEGVENKFVAFAFYQLLFINLYWGLFNLIPVMPLDGGQATREICFLMRLRNPMEATIKVSIVASAIAAFYFFQNDYQFAGIMFAMFCFQNYQSLQQRRY